MSVVSLSGSQGRDRSRRYPFAVRQALSLCSHLENGSLHLVMPDGETFTFGGKASGPDATIRILDLAFARGLAQGDIGIAEAYMRGEWDSPDLTAFLQLFCANQQAMERLMEGKPVARMLQMAWHWLHRNTKAGSRRNIHAHYDLSNEFFATFLDPSMTYSCAIFDDPSWTLDRAQEEKIDRTCRKLALKPTDHLLEIGSGWVPTIDAGEPPTLAPTARAVTGSNDDSRANWAAKALASPRARAWVRVTSSPPASAQVSPPKLDSVAPPVPGRVMVGSPVTVVCGV